MPKQGLATDPPVSEAQRKAMGAAMSGHSNIGIPASVGKEFIDADPGGSLPKKKAKDAPSRADITRQMHLGYIQGNNDAVEGKPRQNPYKPGEAGYQPYDAGYNNGKLKRKDTHDDELPDNGVFPALPPGGGDASPFRFACDSVPDCQARIVKAIGKHVLLIGMAQDTGAWFTRGPEGFRRHGSSQEALAHIEYAQDAEKIENVEGAKETKEGKDNDWPAAEQINGVQQRHGGKVIQKGNKFEATDMAGITTTHDNRRDAVEALAKRAKQGGTSSDAMYTARPEELQMARTQVKRMKPEDLKMLLRQQEGSPSLGPRHPLTQITRQALQGRDALPGSGAPAANTTTKSSTPSLEEGKRLYAELMNHAQKTGQGREQQGGYSRRDLEGMDTPDDLRDKPMTREERAFNLKKMEADQAHERAMEQSEREHAHRAAEAEAAQRAQHLMKDYDYENAQRMMQSRDWVGEANDAPNLMLGPESGFLSRMTGGGGKSSKGVAEQYEKSMERMKQRDAEKAKTSGGGGQQSRDPVGKFDEVPDYVGMANADGGPGSGPQGGSGAYEQYQKLQETQARAKRMEKAGAKERQRRDADFAKQLKGEERKAAGNKEMFAKLGLRPSGFR